MFPPPPVLTPTNTPLPYPPVFGSASQGVGGAEMVGSQHPDARVASLGLAFKPNIDDFRESPAVEVAAALARRFGKQIDIVEPYARGLPMEFAGTGAQLIDLDTALAKIGRAHV